MLGAPTANTPQEVEEGGIFGAIAQFAEQNPELASGLLGGVISQAAGQDFGVGALAATQSAGQVRQSQLAAQKEQAERATKQENVLRKEFNTKTKKFDAVVAAQKKIDAALSRGTAAGDLAGIFSYMKVLDPGSTVREEEFANAENSAGVPERVRGAYNKAVLGKRLSQNQREDFLRTSRELYESEKEVFNQNVKQFSGIAERQRLDIRNVVPQKSFKLTPIEEIIERSRKNKNKNTPKEGSILGKLFRSDAKERVFGGIPESDLRPSEREGLKKAGIL